MSKGLSAASTSSISSGARPIFSSAGSITKCSSQRPPTQKVWASCQLMAPARSGWRLNMTDFDNLVLDQAAGGLNRHHVTLLLANQGTGDG